MNVAKTRVLVRRRTIVLIGLLLYAFATVSIAQRFFGDVTEGPGNPIRLPSPDFEDGRFTFCKIMYTSVRREMMGIGWWTDYPYAGMHLVVRLSELTKPPISTTASGDPNHWVVRLTDPALFQCPFVMASDVGTIGLAPDGV